MTGGAEREHRWQLNKNHSLHTRIFFLPNHTPPPVTGNRTLQGAAAFTVSTGTKAQCHHGHKALAALQWSLCPLLLPCHLHRPPALCVTLRIQSEVGLTSCRELSTLQIQHYKGGEVVDGKKRFSEARGTEPRSSVAFQTHETSSKETSSATWGFENTQETGPTERKAAERSHRNPGGDPDSNWLPYTDVFMNFSPLTPSHHALCNQPEYDNTPSSS